MGAESGRVSCGWCNVHEHPLKSHWPILRTFGNQPGVSLLNQHSTIVAPERFSSAGVRVPQPLPPMLRCLRDTSPELHQPWETRPIHRHARRVLMRSRLQDIRYLRYICGLAAVICTPVSQICPAMGGRSCEHRVIPSSCRCSRNGRCLEQGVVSQPRLVARVSLPISISFRDLQAHTPPLSDS